MLTVTAAAAESIVTLAEQGGVSDEGGLRVEAAPDDTEGKTFALSLAQAPAEGDEVVVVRQGASIFLEPSAAVHLADKVLDVRKNVEGHIKFRLLRQG